MTLLMVGFLLGGKLTRDSLRLDKNKILWLSISAALITALLVGLGLTWAGVPIEVAILLGCIASATAPAAILDAVFESNDKGSFGQLLLSIVAIDDAWALLLFGIGVAVVSTLNGHATEGSTVFIAFKDVGGAVLLGLLVGFPSAFFTGRYKLGQPILSEALGVVFVCGGLAMWLDVSF